MIQIGNISLNGQVVLGPMAGITDLAYREFMKPFGVALSISEMISVTGLVYGNQATKEYYRSSFNDHPLALQLFGGRTEDHLKAIEILERDAEYEILDLNFGCPMPKVLKGKGGSFWLKDPSALYEHVRTIVAHSHKPVSAKIRLGFDQEHINACEVSKLLEEAGVSLISIHARTTKQLYSGQAQYQEIANLGRELKIPLCISGDIFSVEEAIKAMEDVGAQLVMVARGGVGHPRLVLDLDRSLKGLSPLPKETYKEQIDYALSFLEVCKNNSGEQKAFLHLKGILPHFLKGFSGYRKARNFLASEATSLQEMSDFLLDLKGSFNDKNS